MIVQAPAQKRCLKFMKGYWSHFESLQKLQTDIMHIDGDAAYRLREFRTG